jgi:hypothetical protein
MERLQASNEVACREERLRFGEAQLRQKCAGRGLDWDLLSEAERETFVDDLLHDKSSPSQNHAIGQ